MAEPAPSQPTQTFHHAARAFWRRFRRNRGAVAGLAILAVIALVALGADVLRPGDPFRLAGAPFAPPFGEFLFGTDSLGRDVAAGMMHGARTSLLIGLVATLAALLLGTLIGGVAGYYGGWLDDVLMRITEIFQTIPFFIFAILLIAILRPSIGSIVFAIALVSWPGVARLVRGEFLSLRSREYVQACVIMGMPEARIIFLQILPNALSPIIVTGSLMVATAILTESALAFLGLSDPNVMSWGFQIGSGRTHLRTAWWVCTFPGLVIMVTALGINLVGEGLNDALNPRLRDR
ncbi:MAG: ABC transporter permease [Betaproteobacteria bacterium]|nr:ABC transporter permease [Betaproteobacteria bacterium]MBM3355751.1 ABC transporter permease [Betaproteobacteria bacterium]MBM3383658.1 ABC transporter permease [Betaproteobacteria bacterium]